MTRGAILECGDQAWEEKGHTTILLVRSVPSFVSLVGVPMIVSSMVAAPVREGVTALKWIVRRVIPGPGRVMTTPRSRGSTFSMSISPTSPSLSWALFVEN